KPVGDVLPRSLQLVGGDNRLSPALPPTCGGSGQPGLGALADQVALELAQRAKTWKMSRPPGVVVSMLSVSDLKPTPRASSAAIVSMRCGIERPSRSRRQMASTSPARK
ncbi:hypothetical protein XGA_1166, partial [Xanthomonas hortorum ATCC 19865]